MKLLITLVLIGTKFYFFSQDTTFFNIHENKTSQWDSCIYYEVKVIDINDSNMVTVNSFYKSGAKKSRIHFNPYSKKRINGDRIEWHQNGQIKKKLHYQNDTINGVVTTYWNNGKLKRKDTFQHGNFIDGINYDSLGNEIEHFDFEVLPDFPGGPTRLQYYIQNNFRYPRKAVRKNTQGKVVVIFTVNTLGEIGDIRVFESVSEELDNEAIRLVKNMPKWKPKVEDGEITSEDIRLPIVFNIVD